MTALADLAAASGALAGRSSRRANVKVAFNELQRSRQYPAGLALRFARVRGDRPDKAAHDADHIDTVRMLFERQAADHGAASAPA